MHHLACSERASIRMLAISQLTDLQKDPMDILNDHLVVTLDVTNDLHFTECFFVDLSDFKVD